MNISDICFNLSWLEPLLPLQTNSHNQCKMKELEYLQMTFALLCVSWFLKLYLTVCDQNGNKNILLSSSVIFATLSRQGINYDPVLKKDPDNFALLNDPSTLRSKENEHQGKGYGGGGGHAFEDV